MSSTAFLSQPHSFSSLQGPINRQASGHTVVRMEMISWEHRLAFSYLLKPRILWAGLISLHYWGSFATHCLFEAAQPEWSGTLAPRQMRTSFLRLSSPDMSGQGVGQDQDTCCPAMSYTVSMVHLRFMRDLEAKEYGNRGGQCSRQTY